MSDNRDILDDARDFLRPHGSADEVARYPTAALVLRLADELRQTRAAFGDIDEQQRLIAQLQSMLDRCSEKLWVEWVPTEEQLPVKDGEVLVAWDQHEKVAVGHFGNGEWRMEVAEYGPPTHWMPLPDGPRPPVPDLPTQCP